MIKNILLATSLFLSIAVAEIGFAKPIFSAAELRTLAAFSELVYSRRFVTCTSTEVSGVLKTQDFLDNLKCTHWDQKNALQAEISAFMRSHQTSLTLLANLYIRFVKDLSFGGPGLNQILSDNTDLAFEIQKIARTLFNHEDYSALLEKQNTQINLFSISYAEPLKSAIMPIIKSSSADIISNEKFNRHFISFLGGLAFMNVAEVASLFLPLREIKGFDPIYLLYGMPALVAGGWIACELLLMRKPIRNPMSEDSGQ